MTRIRVTLTATAVATLVLTGLSPAAGLRGDGVMSTSDAVVDGRIVYLNADTGQLETINPDGTARVEVTSEGLNIQPRWMPGSERIVFTSDRSGTFSIYTVAADGSDVQQVTTGLDGAGDFTPGPTPDGQRILFTRCRPDPVGYCALFSVRTDGSDLQPVTPYDVRYDFWPDVSPDGTRLAFNRDEYRGIADQIWVADIDGSDAHPVSDVALEASDPRWTPDGRHLLVTDAWHHFGESVVRIPDEPGPAQRLTAPNFPNNDLFADASPSGRRIVFCSDRAYPGIIGGDLFVMRPNGNRQTAITSDGRLLEPDWGTAPLLPPEASTSATALAPALSATQRAALVKALALTQPSTTPTTGGSGAGLRR